MLQVDWIHLMWVRSSGRLLWIS